MTAASGILHKEYHEETFSREGGDFQMVQLWINLPAKYKMSKPKYQALPNDKINKYHIEDHGGVIEVIAGKYKDVAGTASTFSPINLLNARLHKDAKSTFSFPENYNTTLLVIEGSLAVNKNEQVPTDHLVLFENIGEEFTIQALEDTVVLILSGEPIEEPIEAQGPFVMNTREEIMLAMSDFRMGKFGNLEN